jgi:hypothetical protein
MSSYQEIGTCQGLAILRFSMVAKWSVTPLDSRRMVFVSNVLGGTAVKGNVISSIIFVVQTSSALCPTGY